MHTLCDMNDALTHIATGPNLYYNMERVLLPEFQWGKLCENAAQDLRLPTSVIAGSSIIDSYAGWVGTIGAPVEVSRIDEFPLRGWH
jgi:ribulose kinase